jgi:hypothetical protein
MTIPILLIRLRLDLLGPLPRSAKHLDHGFGIIVALGIELAFAGHAIAIAHQEGEDLVLKLAYSLMDGRDDEGYKVLRRDLEVVAQSLREQLGSNHSVCRSQVNSCTSNILIRSAALTCAVPHKGVLELVMVVVEIETYGDDQILHIGHGFHLRRRASLVNSDTDTLSASSIALTT